jgi:membrane-associated phospholipid phosphatase
MEARRMPRGRRCAGLVLAGVLAGTTPALAQSARSTGSSCGDAPSVGTVAKETLHDFGRLRSSGSLGLLTIGGVAAFGAHSVDSDVTREFPNAAGLNGAFKPGAVIGGTPFQLGAAIGTYAIGRAFGKSCVARVGADLIQAQLLAEGLTTIFKEATRRSRPEGTGFSFPSGHTTVTFASATVLQRHFGWKVGVPAYAVASYVAASRVEMKRHYLSDVAFGAALGIVAGRTVPIGHGRSLLLTPMASPSAVGAQFTLIGK